MLAGFGFEPDIFRCRAQNAGHALPHRRLVLSELRLLGKNNAVEIDQMETSGLHLLPGPREHVRGVTSAIDLVGIGEHIANITKRRSTEQGIGNGVQQNVRVAVADRVPVVRNVHSANSERPSVGQPMRVVTNADSKASRSTSPYLLLV